MKKSLKFEGVGRSYITQVVFPLPRFLCKQRSNSFFLISILPSQARRLCNEPVPIQDPTHVATKGRNRFLRQHKPLRMGDCTCSLEHLKYLLRNIPKTEHGLSEGDIDANDRMKFLHVQNLLAPRVLYCLDKYVSKEHDTRGTIIYFELLRNIIDSFTSTEILAEKRIYILWESIIFFRIWKGWVTSEKNLKVDTNFVTSNFQTCLEINGHGLLNIISQLRSENMEQCFLPWLFDSQACEETFRTARSMSGTQSTVINFCVKEFIHRMNRIEVLTSIPSKLGDCCVFPRKQKRANPPSLSLPNDLELIDIVNKSIESAKQKAISVGININEKWIYEPQIKVIDDVDDEEEDEESEIYAETSDDETEEPLDLSEIHKMYPAFDKNKISLSSAPSKSSSTVTVVDKDSNEEFEIKISTLCWFFDTQEVAPSTDRNKRFHSNKKKSQVIVLETEQYYAVVYEKWYIGRIVHLINDEQAKIKFLYESCGEFTWPKKPDTQVCDKEYIIYGPITLLESHPFKINTNTREQINKAYKKFQNSNK